MALRIHQQQASMGFTAAQQERTPIYQWFFPFWALVFGAVARRVRSRRHISSNSFDRSLARSSLQALFAGFVAYFAVFVAYDIFTAR